MRAPLRSSRIVLMMLSRCAICCGMVPSLSFMGTYGAPVRWVRVGVHHNRSNPHWRALIGANMDITTLLIIVVVVLFLGGGWYGRGRWY